MAVLGSGHWGRNLIRYVQAFGDLEMVCDPDSAAIQMVPGITVSGKLEDAISKE
jgi:hypothetical protein